MGVKVGDIVATMSRIAPPALAEDWDNVGLQVGSADWPVKKIWIALDPLPEVVKRAGEQGVTMLITHHPLIFRPVKSIDMATPLGAVIETAIKKEMAIFCAHTNLDAAREGINDMLVDRIGLEDVLPLVNSEKGNELGERGTGLGRVGDLPTPLNLYEFSLRVKRRLDLSSIRVVGEPDMMVKKVAICSGSGSGLMKAFFASGAQVYVSGDIRYHDARDVQAAERAVLDVGHFSSEHIMVSVLAQRLEKELLKTGMAVPVEACNLETDPFRII